MQTNTSPQYWFQIPSKSTEELTTIWASGTSVDNPEIDLELVEQVLMARHVLEPSQAFLAIPQVGHSEKAMEKIFPISQKIGKKMNRRWTVALERNQAVFSARDGSERFVIDREKARPEFQFKQSGFLLLSEGTSAFVRGKTFDFGERKTFISDWLPKPTQTDLRKEQTGWGIALILVGAITLIMGTPVAPIIGSVLVFLGILNFVLRNQAMWVVNGLGWLVNGALMLGSTVFFHAHWSRSNLVVTLFWTALGLVQVVLGFQSARKFDRS